MGTNRDANTWAMLIHLSIFTGYIVPIAGLVVPIILWQMKKNEYPEIDVHGREVVNFIISMFIYSLICIPLCFVVIGFLGLIVLSIVGIVYPIIGGIKANDGIYWRYPYMIRIL
jgi:uncharacterized Tic20 family protein